jgi:hypothetical protein
MGFLPLFYACGFFFLAWCCYVCISVVGGLDSLGRRVFIAVMAFGVSSYIGFIVILPFLNLLLVKPIQDKQLLHLLDALAYFLPGVLGSWLSLRAFKSCTRLTPGK